MRWSFLGLWLLALVLSSSAVAQEATDQQARIHFQAGTNYFQVADYEAAAREYQRAFELSGRAELMYNLYLCHERLGNLDDAVSWLERYLAESEEVQRRENLEARLATMRRRLEERASGEEEGEHAVDADATPLGPGEGLTSASDEPAPPDEATGEAPAETGPPSSSGAAAPATPPRGGGGGGISGGAIASWVVAGVFLGTFAAFGGVALAEDGRLENDCPSGCPDEEIELMRTSMIVADVSLAAAGAAAILGLVLALVDSGGGGEASPASAWIAPDGAGVIGSARF